MGEKLTMNTFSLSTLIKSGLCAFALVVLMSVVPTFAQNNNNAVVTNTNDRTRVVERDDNTDWGWIGLLGLAGLAGLLKKPREVVVQRDRDVDPNTRR